MTVFTIGHSTQDRDEFIARCRSAGIRTVVDVRSHPSSRWEWFERDQMEGPGSWLAKAGIGYRWEPDLGGWSERDTELTIPVQPSTGMPIPRDAPPGGYTVNQVPMPEWAARHGVDLDQYIHGYFPKGHISKQVDPGQGPGWTSRGMLDYAWYMATPGFIEAADRLTGGELPSPGLMCAEFVWWKCHRSLIADYLVYQGTEVVHVQPAIRAHTKDRIGRYPDQVVRCWGRAA